MNAEDLADIESIEEGEPEVADERWLMSYADMMTLLFGLFVLLYAMQERMDIIEHSAQKEFNTQKVESKAPEAVPNATAVALPPLTSLRQIEFLQNERTALLTKIVELKAELNTQAAEPGKLDRAERARENLTELVRSKDVQLKALEQERNQLKAKLAPAGPVVNVPTAQTQPVPPPAVQVDGGDGHHTLNLTLKAVLPSGREFVAKMKKMTLTGMLIDQVPPEDLGKTFQATLSREDGTAVSVDFLAVLGPDNYHTRHLVILSFPKSGDEDILAKWLREAQ